MKGFGMTYKVPFVDYPKQYRCMESEIDGAIKEVLSQGDLILRDQLRAFEESMATFIGTKHAVGVSSGTDALMLSLRAIGIGPGDEVITVAHTFVATIAAIVHCGATPVLVDIGDDYNMDVDLVEQATTPKTRGIIPVHLNGRVCDMSKLMEISKKHALVVVEDAAQALGARVDGRNSGTFGLTSCFSFYPAKLLGCAGDGGLVATDSDSIAGKIRLHRDHGTNRATGDILFYGFTNRLDNLQAAILRVKLKRLPMWIERRREIAGMYESGLSRLPEVQLPPAPQTDGRYFDVYQNYVIRAQDRDRLVVYLRDKGIETLISNRKPVQLHEPLGLGCFHLPKTEQFANEVVSLPMNSEISDTQVGYVIDSVRSFFGAGGGS